MVSLMSDWRETVNWSCAVGILLLKCQWREIIIIWVNMRTISLMSNWRETISWRCAVGILLLKCEWREGFCETSYAASLKYERKHDEERLCETRYANFLKYERIECLWVKRSWHDATEVCVQRDCGRGVRGALLKCEWRGTVREMCYSTVDSGSHGVLLVLTYWSVNWMKKLAMDRHLHRGD